MERIEDLVCELSEAVRCCGVYSERTVVDKILCELARKLDEALTGESANIVVTANLELDGTYKSNYTYEEIRAAHESGCKCSLIASVLNEDGSTPTSCVSDVSGEGADYLEWETFGLYARLFANGNYEFGQTA